MDGLGEERVAEAIRTAVVRGNEDRSIDRGRDGRRDRLDLEAEDERQQPLVDRLPDDGARAEHAGDRRVEGRDAHEQHVTEGVR